MHLNSNDVDEGLIIIGAFLVWIGFFMFSPMDGSIDDDLGLDDISDCVYFFLIFVSYVVPDFYLEAFDIRDIEGDGW